MIKQTNESVKEPKTMQEFYQYFFKPNPTIEDLMYYTDDFNKSKGICEKFFPHLRKLRPGELADIIGDPACPDPRFKTNITAYEAVSGPLVEMNWGYLGTGPHTFARNILYHFTQGDSDFAHRHDTDFIREFFENIPSRKKVHIIKKEQVLAWIKDRRREFFVSNKSKGGQNVQ